MTLIKDATPFPYVLQCERLKVCDEALKMVAEHELCDLRMGCPFVSFEQGADFVEARFEQPDGSQGIVRGRYIVSAEGGRSIVRKALDIDFEGFTYPDRTLNITTTYDFTRHGYSHRNYISDPGEWMNLFHWAGPPQVWRVHFHTDPDDSEERLLSRENCQAMMQRFMPKDTPYEILGARLFTIHQRIAASFRKGRAILAGDSAHVNSPIGGMGMNSGVHDAMNLGDKLLAIWRGEGGDEIARPLRAPAPHHRARIHSGADHPQQEAADRSRSGDPAEEPRRPAPHRRGSRSLHANSCCAPR